MTMNNKTTTSLTMILMVSTVSLSMGLLFAPEAFALNCFETAGDHCYAIAVLDNINAEGVQGDMAINGGNYVKNDYAISNSFWIVFATNEWVEVGWQKGDILPCSDTSANFFYYSKIDGDTSDSSCEGSVSGSVEYFALYDSNQDYDWGVFIDSQIATIEDTGYLSGEARTGGESTHDDNLLDDGNSDNLDYLNSNEQWADWDSNAYRSQDSPYTTSWGSPTYEELNYDGGNGP